VREKSAPQALHLKYYNMSDKPHAPERRFKLVSPFITGSGKDFDTILVFHEGAALHPGMILSTDRNNLIRVMAKSVFEEDFFENITITLCQLMTNDPHDTVDQESRELWYMYSAGSKE
jgi:hypothetical protein